MGKHETKEQEKKRLAEEDKFFKECTAEEDKCNACRYDYCTGETGWCLNKCITNIGADAEFRLDKHHIYVDKVHEGAIMWQQGIGVGSEIESIDGHSTVNEMRTAGVDLHKALWDLDPNKEHEVVFHNPFAHNKCTHEETCCMKAEALRAPSNEFFVDCPAKAVCKDEAVCDEVKDPRGPPHPDVCNYQVQQLPPDPPPPEPPKEESGGGGMF